MKRILSSVKAIVLFIVMGFSLHLYGEETNSSLPSDISLKTDKNPVYYMCKSKNAVRTLRVSFKGDRCHATYTKEGVDSVVGKSNTADVCHDVVTNIKKNLEAGDWKCRDISAARISSSL